MQSKIFELYEADQYFNRNKNNNNNLIARYLLSRMNHEKLKNSALASFGIGSGFNLVELEKYFKVIHGFDVSGECINNFKAVMGPKYDGQRIYVERLNLCERFHPPIRYDIVLYDWFAYLVTNEELDNVKINLINSLKPGGGVVVHDFIVRDYREKPDSHNPRLRIFKRNLNFWLNHFYDFDLLAFNLFSCQEYSRYLNEKRIAEIDCKLTESDDGWVFCAFFRIH